MRVGLGFDVHPFGDTEPLVLAGVEIDAVGLVGHSDADVVAHAVADALLGPAGLDDLGTMFPASDARGRDADSMMMLRAVVERVRQADWSVVNVDVVVAAETPTLAPHVDAMTAALRETLSAAGGDPYVSLRPKRGEGIGSIGRSEGIAVWAVALIERASSGAGG